MGELLLMFLMGYTSLVAHIVTAFGLGEGWVMLFQYLSCFALIIGIYFFIWWVYEVSVEIEGNLKSSNNTLLNILGYVVMPFRLFMTAIVMLFLIAGAYSAASMARDWWHAGGRK